jgi:hypothetical protein
MGRTFYLKHFSSGLVLPVLALSMLATGAANAAFFNNSTGLPSPSQTIDFSEHAFADNTVITNQFSDLGVTFSPNLYYQNIFPNPPGPPFDVPNSTGADLTNFITGPGTGLVNPFSINFSSPVTGAAFVLATNGDPATLFTAFLMGVPVDAGTAATGFNNSTDFYGFMGVTFDKITVSVNNNDGFAILDTLQIVPEPSSWVLMFVGGIVLVAGARLRKVMA